MFSLSRFTSVQQRDYLEKVVAQSRPVVFLDAKAYNAVRDEIKSRAFWQFQDLLLFQAMKRPYYCCFASQFNFLSF